MSTLSALIITHNEEKHIGDCIKSLQDIADEIILLDSASTDRTKETAESLGAKVYTDTDWQGYGIHRQKTQKFATCDWCVWLDADERITPELGKEIKECISGAENNQILNISRANHVFGIRVRHCGYFPDRVMRVHNRLYTTYNDSKVHEKLLTPEGTKIINSKNSLLHYTYADYIDLQNKQIKYADLWAADRLAKKNKGCCFITPFIKGAFAFFRQYVLQLGFLDGKIGLTISSCTAMYTFNKYMTLHLRATAKKNS